MTLDNKIDKKRKSLIHVARHQLRMGDGEYRKELMETVGVSSASDVTFRNFPALMDRFKALGFVGRSNGGERKISNLPAAERGIMFKIDGVRKQLGYSWKKVDAIAKQAKLGDSVWFLKGEKLHKVLQMLMVHKKRTDKKASADTGAAGTPVPMKECPAPHHRGERLLEITSENFYSDSQSSDGHSSWCKACTKSRYTPKPKPDLHSGEFKKDGRGRMVKKEDIDPFKLLTDEVVNEVVGQARELQANLVDFKAESMAKVAMLAEEGAKKHDVSLGGAKGNITLLSFDGSLKIQIQIGEFWTADTQILAAKKLADTCLEKWSANGQYELRDLVTDYFSVNADGYFNIDRLKRMLRKDYDDPDWTKAQAIVRKSLTVVNTKSYIRFYHRTGRDSWRRIPLNLAETEV